jgi:hypothetical protein
MYLTMCNFSIQVPVTGKSVTKEVHNVTDEGYSHDSYEFWIEGDTTGPFTLNVLTMVDPGQHSVVMGLSPACVTPGERFEVTWNDLGNNMLSCSPTAVSPKHSRARLP